MTPRRYSFVAAAVFLGEAAFALIHLLVGATYRWHTHGASVVVDLLLLTVWLTAATACLLGRRALLALVTGVVVSAIHGAMFSLASSHWGVGLPFFFAVPVVAGSLARSWSGIVPQRTFRARWHERHWFSPGQPATA